MPEPQKTKSIFIILQLKNVYNRKNCKTESNRKKKIGWRNLILYNSCNRNQLKSGFSVVNFPISDFKAFFEPKTTKCVFGSGIPLVRLFWVWAGWVGKIDTVRVRSFSVVHPLPNFLDNSLQTFYETKHNRPEIIFKYHSNSTQQRRVLADYHLNTACGSKKTTSSRRRIFL